MITVTVYYGNHNYFHIDLPPSLKVGLLVTILPVVINKHIDDVLYIILCGQIVGKGYAFDTPLSDCNILESKCTAFMILKPPPSSFGCSALDQLTAERNRSWLSRNKQSTSTSSASNTLTGSRMMDLLGAVRDLNFNILEDVAVTVPEAEYAQYVTPLSHDPADVCTICHDNIVAADGVQLACAHAFHNTCIHTWLTVRSVKCPTCNYDVRDAGDVF